METPPMSLLGVNSNTFRYLSPPFGLVSIGLIILYFWDFDFRNYLGLCAIGLADLDLGY